jgi:rRNA maturation RNase YbeY
VTPKRKYTAVISKMLDSMRASTKWTLTKYPPLQSAQWSDPQMEECTIPHVHENMLLGDIVISYNTVWNEASLFGKTFDARVSHLFVHGLLHILGYDHVSEQDRRKMEKLETEILKSCGIKDPYILA